MLEQPKEIICRCGHPMKLRKGKFGEFWGCTAYPDCKETMTLKEAGLYHMDEIGEHPDSDWLEECFPYHEY